MFDPIKASKNIRDEFVSYISTTFNLADQEYARQFKAALNKDMAISKGPYLDISDSFESGKSISQLVESGEMSSLFSELEPGVAEGDKEIKLVRSLYKHQEKAVRKINEGKNIVVTTGTGSGKTECFILPIINHLLKEKEAGTLNDGVRAILIYPMNALANDQMKRLRLILKNYPDITFGVYNSSTAHEDADGIAEYGRVFKDKDGKALKPLKNEAISRKTMQKRPPHILVTNYAMLEYMMLRPNDDLVFSQAKLRFIVLDEAHIYKGATGIETSLLLRRLKARISNPKKVLHILTSATLGGKEADADIVLFASTLCDAEFDADDIIRSKTVMPPIPEESVDIPLELFEKLAHPSDSMDSILEQYGCSVDSSKSDAENLFDLCISSKAYRVLRECTTKPMTVQEITSAMNSKMPIQDSDLVNLIYVASKAEKNKTSLIKARYHMFIRALEGAYITLGPVKHLYLIRQNYVEVDDDTWKVFEAAVCDDCGRIGVAGKTVNGRLESLGNSYDEDMEVYLIREQGEELDIDEDDYEEDGEIGKEDYVICAKCGEIHHESQKMDFSCNHGTANLVKVRKAERKGIRNESKCPCCNFGHMKLFYIGYDAATAVLGTELFEQLPESEEKLATTTVSVTPTTNLFAMAEKPKTRVDVVKKKRQYLTFSDSRSAAAFYACYMSSFYKEFLRRRGIWHVIEKNRENIADKPWEITTLVQELTAYFDANRTFASPGDDGKENLTATSRKQAWIAVLNEMVNARRSTSLVSLGILDFVYKGNSEELMAKVAKLYGQNATDINALFNLLVMDIVYGGALESGDISLTNDEREYIYYTARPRRFTKCKSSDIDRKKTYLSGWIPRVRENGKSYKNGRLIRLMKMMQISEEDAKGLLAMYWDGVLKDGNYSLTLESDGEYYFSTDKFVVVVGNEKRPLYICNKCGKTTMINCKNSCTSLKCDGHLSLISRDALIDGNHYARLYSEKLMSPLHIKEHTAQLGRAEQQKYQEMFVNKEINALSCSTTFEMGVDVGDLETVFLRNMPPSPANYVQRAGRAGRSIHSAAYSLTYSKLSSHDFTYFEHPEWMISGKIGVPLFSITNEKVILRHIFAVALSSFFALMPEVYNGNDADVLLNKDGYERLVSYLNSKPADLYNLLLKSIPEEMHFQMGITDWSWVDKLVGVDGALSVAVKDFRDTVDFYEKEIKKLNKTDDLQGAARCQRQLMDFRRGKEDKIGRNELIEFLVRYNVLPKYGFPVDTVELYQGTNYNQDKKLQMVRDLQLAIAEYAPDAQVVADGKLYTSRYIRKLPNTSGQDWKEVYIAQCRNQSCMTWNHRITEPQKEETCISCGSKIERARWMKAIEPRKGFIAESKSKDVPLRKPDRSYRSDDYYIGDPTRKIMYKKTFRVFDNEKIQMETSTNDSLMVVCNDHFYVCNKCGYAISSTMGKEDKNFNSYKKSYERKHKSPWGKVCSGKLYRKELCHSFKTDVVRVTFGTSRAKNQSTMLSVMYALLEAISSVLDIERTDIKGCLHKVRFERSMIYQIILYDAVAGGAGHVRRLVTKNCDVFQRVVKKAIDITKGCTCNPSCYNCLRNYYNQAIHDMLNREEVYPFLEHYYGPMTSIPNDSFEENRETAKEELTDERVKFGNGYSCTDYQNWSELSPMIQKYQEVFSDMDIMRVPLPSELDCPLSVRGTNLSTEVMLVWNKQKILVFDNDKEKMDIQGWKCLYVSEIDPSEFAKNFR